MEPVINAEFEILAAIDSLPRESVFIDSKYKFIWKIQDSTQKLTSTGQVYGYTVNARTIHSSEMLYSLKLFTEPFVAINYRGVERSEGGVTQQYWPDSKDVPNSFTLPEYDENLYNQEES
jgi:hypothetical protein